VPPEHLASEQLAPLRVAMLAPIAWRVPPRHYGPWERVVSLLTEGLIRAGVDVTLFATADSLTSASLSAVVASGYEETPGMDVKVAETLHLANLFDRAAEFDVIHNHADFLPLSYAGLVETPTVTTIHGFSGPSILPIYQRYDQRTSYVAISEADRHPDLRYVATVHHGIDLREFTFQPQPGEYLLFFGRMHPDKGAADAVRIARASGKPLLLAGIIQDQEYFRCEVEPHLNADVRYLGSVGPQERDRLLGGALALLHPIHFNEPFGLSMVEAIACGTPVIAYPRGSVPEVVGEDGGYIVQNEAEAVLAVGQAEHFDRGAARARVERHFTVERMVAGYLEVYARLRCVRDQSNIPYGLSPESSFPK
jgi:glycosyltransferase involved in cell wall biosynthesis